MSRYVAESNVAVILSDVTHWACDRLPVLMAGICVPLFTADAFQGNLLRTVLQLEKVYFDLAEQDEENVIVVCDRGAMDPSACTGKCGVGVEECVRCLCGMG